MLAQDQMRGILDRHCASLDEQIGAIGEKLAKAMLGSEEFLELTQEALSVTHRLAGSSGTLGFQEIGQIALQLEEALDEIVRLDTTPDETRMHNSHRLFTRLKEVTGQAKPEDSGLYNLDPDSLGPPRE